MDRIHQVWCEILGVKRIGKDVTFFDAGGDSLLLVVLLEMLSELAGREIQAAELFRASTIRSQATLLQ